MKKKNQYHSITVKWEKAKIWVKYQQEKRAVVQLTVIKVKKVKKVK